MTIYLFILQLLTCFKIFIDWRLELFIYNLLDHGLADPISNPYIFWPE
jgi:hypothetical protein